MQMNNHDEPTHFNVTYAFSPKSYADVKHKEVAVKEIEKIAGIVGITWFHDNEAFRGKSPEEILKEASTGQQFLIAIEAGVPENFNVFAIDVDKQTAIEEILSSYNETFTVDSPINIFIA